MARRPSIALEQPGGERFARDLLAAAGCRALIGYKTDLDWMPSMLTDLLFFERFYSHPDPWKALSATRREIKQYEQGIGVQD